MATTTKRRWFRFSLRTLLVVVLVAAVSPIMGVADALAQFPPGKHIPKSTSPVNALAICPDSKLLITGDVLGRVLVFSLIGGQKIGRLPGHEKSITALTFGAEKAAIFSAARDGRVIMWDTRTAKRVREFTVWEESYSVFGALALAVSSDQRLLLIAEGCQSSLWNVRKGTRVRTLLSKYDIVNVRFSSDDKLALVGGGGYAAAWDVATGTASWELENVGIPSRPIKFFPCAQEVLMKTFEDEPNGLRYGVWHGPSGKKRFVLRYDEPVARVAVTSDGKEIVTLFHTGRVARWDAHNGRLVAKYEAEGTVPGVVAVSPDKKWLAVTSSKGVILLNAVSRKVHKRIVIESSVSSPKLLPTTDAP